MYRVSVDSVKLATGGLFRTVFTAFTVSVASSSSVTIKVTTYVPLSAYACVIIMPVALVPSLKSQK